MTHSPKYILGFISLAFLFIYPLPAFAEFNYQLTPGIAVSEDYNDNLFLSETDEVSDYITGITPSLSFDIITEPTNLQFYYAPTFVFYRDNKQYDTTRQLATLTWGQGLSKHLRFDLKDTYYRSEQPIEYSDVVVGVRKTRQTYQRNLGEISGSFLFGPENKFSLGYSVNHVVNEDPTIDNGRVQNLPANLAYWFNVRNGLELNYQYTKADFSRDVGVAQDDFTGNAGGARYIYRFNPHSSIFVGYNITTRDFDVLPADFDVNEGLAGLEHSFTPNVSLSLSGGYFKVDFKEFDDSETGPTYSALLTTRFERGTFTIGGAGGWWFYGEYIDPQNRGVTKYYRGDARIEYELAERFSIYAGGFYRLDSDVITNREWDIWRGNAGINWNFLRYCTLSLDYRYANRNDDVDTEDYRNNRVMFIFSISKWYRW
jgi:hypothetical protein